MKIYILLLAMAGMDYSDGLVDESRDTCEISFVEEPTEDTFNELEALHWIKVDMITSEDYTFKYTANDKSIDEAIAVLKNKFRKLITHIDRVQIYSEVARIDNKRTKDVKASNNAKGNIICDHYYGMGVEEAWADGHSGHEVVVAVTDVGVNTDIIELEENINKELSYNYIDRKRDVTPEYFPSYQDLSLLDHGNRCTSVIAAVKGNGICSAGIAYNATIAVVKTFKVTQLRKSGIFVTESNSTIMAKSLNHKKGIIDIYSNSWGFDNHFASLTHAMHSSLKKCAEEGRDGKGAILVFPAGKKINELLNNEYIIAVGAVGKNKTVPEYHVITSAVLTSGLHDGNDVTTSEMVTTTIRNRCITQFSGDSAATAQVAAMIALVLQANPNLTRWDVEDLIVYSSDYVSSSKSDKSYQIENAAGHKFHSVFGPGILNAYKLVTAARKRSFHVRMVKQRLKAYNLSSDARMAVFYHMCGPDGEISSDCVGTIKKAQIEIIYKSSADHIRMTLKSPSATTSVLQDISSDEIDTKGKTRKQTLTSVHFWDEQGYGLWVFKLESNGLRDEIVQTYLTLIGVSRGNTSVNSTLTEEKYDFTNDGQKVKVYHNSAVTIIACSLVSVAIIVLVIISVCKWMKCRNEPSAVSKNVLEFRKLLSKNG